jgi:hypothetical protein
MTNTTKPRKTTGRPSTLSITDLWAEHKRLCALLREIPNGVVTPERGRLLRRDLRVMNEFRDRFEAVKDAYRGF